MRSCLSIVAKVLVLSVLSSGCGPSTDGVAGPTKAAPSSKQEPAIRKKPQLPPPPPIPP
jgi:hypothetical protein